MSFNPRRLLIVDTETVGLRSWAGDAPFAVPLSDEDGNTWYTEWPVNPFTREVTPDEGDLRFLDKLFSNKKTSKVGFNLKFEYLMLLNHGLTLSGRLEDASLLLRIWDTQRRAYKLKDTCVEFGICEKQDEKRLMAEVTRCRRIGKQRGWKIHKDNSGDYWLPRAVDPSSTHCEEYAVKDVFPRTLMLWLLLEDQVLSEPEYRATYEFEMREFFHVVNRMEARGVACSREINTRRLREAEKKGREIRAEIQEKLEKDRIIWIPEKGKKGVNPEPFNPGSPVQLCRVLYEPKPSGYGLECMRYNDNDLTRPSTDWKALREHLTVPIVRMVAQDRSATKEKGNFFQAYDTLMTDDPLTGGQCIHTSYNQLGAPKTSRLSANAPNLQQVSDGEAPNSLFPIQAREPFGPRPGYYWYCFDYSGQEMRIFADVGNIETMLEAFYAGRSIHDHNANLAWGGDQDAAWVSAGYSLELGIASSMVTPRQTESQESILDVWTRHGWNDFKALNYGAGSPQAKAVGRAWLREHGFDVVKAESSLGLKKTKTRAKNLGFARCYGAGPSGVMDMLYCSRRDATTFLRRMDEVHPGMPEFLEETGRIGAAQGFIHNLFKRRLRVDKEHSYKAVNYLVQGTAAEIMKRALCHCVDYIDRVKLDAFPVMTIHDEIVFEVAHAHSYRWLLRGIQGIMQNVGSKVLSVPMPVECARVREHWNQKEKVEL